MPNNFRYLIDDPDLTPLWQAVHARLCTGEPSAAIATVTVKNLSRTGVAALRTWLDTTPQRRRRTAVIVNGENTTVPLRELLQVLQIENHLLREIAEQATGHPVVDRALDNRMMRTRRNELRNHIAQQLPTLPLLTARLAAQPLADDDTDVYKTVAALAVILARIPAKPPIPLPKLAHDATGNPHFFDLNTPGGNRLVAAVAELTGRPEPTRPDLIRDMLADVGILADRLTATVLLHNVDAVGDGPIDRRLRDSTYPVALTLLDLILTPPKLSTAALTVVENPSVLEIAMLRRSHLQLACTSGQLRAVDHVLFQLANRCLTPLRYAGDLDGSGIQIAATVAGLYGAELIAMDPEIIDAAKRDSLAEGDPRSGAATAMPVVYQEHDAVLHRIFGSP
ncbi:TIGR02679 domain-containing protein [Actinoplanes sichuanensis]|uniref:TIGR02679 domain-containing protein n=1 Tax=Actinoplanes sichuanensis TaxID=512349 RepID=A0ABW4A131_9ACTN